MGEDKRVGTSRVVKLLIEVETPHSGGSIGKSVLLFVGAGSLMSIHCYSDQQFPPDSKIYFGSKHLNPPVLENTHYFSINLLSQPGGDQI